VTFKTYVPRRKTPFLQGFAAGPQEYLRYTATFSALLTRNLILAKLSGELFSREIPHWIDGHRPDYTLDSTWNKAIIDRSSGSLYENGHCTRNHKPSPNPD
jgi:hypothetical protein